MNREQKLEAALLTILDNVDYTNSACGFTEMVGAVLPKVVIENAREALAAPPTSEWNEAIDRARSACANVAPGHYIALACVEAVEALKRKERP